MAPPVIMFSIFGLAQFQKDRNLDRVAVAVTSLPATAYSRRLLIFSSACCSCSHAPPLAAVATGLLLCWLLLLLVCSSACGCCSCWSAPPPSASAPRFLPWLLVCSSVAAADAGLLLCRWLLLLMVCSSTVWCCSQAPSTVPSLLLYYMEISEYFSTYCWTNVDMSHDYSRPHGLSMSPYPR